MNYNMNKQSLIAFSIALVLILFLCMPISAQPPSPPDVVVLSDPIRLSADPASITADGVSTSTITADVVWPEGWDVLSGTPACLVNVSFYTTLGDITAYNITLPTSDNQSCIAIATLTAGTESGTATITAWADIAPNETAIVRNSTVVVILPYTTFDVPTKVIIGRTVKIKGTISAGDKVDILIENGNIAYFNDEPVDENKEFEVTWDTVGLQQGSYTIDCYIDCPCDSYDEIETAGIGEDGKTTIRLISPPLTLNLSTNITQPGGSFVINGTVTGTDHVDIITISPGGGDRTGLYEKSYLGVPGITNESIPVENNSFSKTINVSACATPTSTPRRGGGEGGGGGAPRDSDGDGISDIDEMLAGTDPNDPCDPNPECAACLAMRGAYIIWVSIPGRDGEYGAWSTAGNASELIKHIIDDYCGGDVDELRSKTQEQILAILKNATIDATVSDDVACVMELNVRYPSYIFSITVSPLVVALHVGETKQFNATAYDQYDAEMPDIVFAWASSSETVGTVDAPTGLFTALAMGTTRITATNGTVSGTASVTVTRHYVGGGGGSAPRDSDGDGYSDIDEMLAGTNKDDPCDPNPECAACLAIRPPTPSPTPSPTPKPIVTPTTPPLITPTPSPTPTPPGFEAVFAIAGLLAVAYLLRRRG